MNDPVAHYLTLTKDVLPRMAALGGRQWPVRNDHCFQRIVLDTICGDVWYDHIDRPAYRNLTEEQALQAARLCDDIAQGCVDLHSLNAQSLAWRKMLKHGQQPVTQHEML